MAEMSLWKRIARALGFGGPPAEPEAPSSAPAEAAFDFDDPRIPDASKDRVLLIKGLVADLEQRAVECGVTSELLELRRMRTVHLPKLLESYIQIPPEYRAEVFRETGRSASFLLNERLDKMAARLREISTMLARGQLNAFAENMRFIDMRYGSTPFD
jgi:hypothetical protein